MTLPQEAGKAEFMTDAPEADGKATRQAGAPRPQPGTREERLAEALRANLRRRKAQARERRNRSPVAGSDGFSGTSQASDSEDS